jgi:hypothetical protein
MKIGDLPPSVGHVLAEPDRAANHLVAIGRFIAVIENRLVPGETNLHADLL